ESENRAGEKHGCYSTRLAEDPRVHELEEVICDSAPWITETDRITVQLLAITLARLERGVAALAVVDDASGNPAAPYLVGDRAALSTLRNDVRLWVGQAAKLASSLGLDPLSRSRLGVNVARIRESPVVEMQ